MPDCTVGATESAVQLAETRPGSALTQLGAELLDAAARGRTSRVTQILRSRWRELLDANEGHVVAQVLPMVPRSEEHSGWHNALQGSLALIAGNIERAIAGLRRGYAASAGLAQARIAVDLLTVFMAHDVSDSIELAALKETRTADKGVSAMLAGLGAFHDRAMCDAVAAVDSALSAARSSADEAAIATLLLIKSRLDYSNQRVTSAIALASDAANLAAAGSNKRLEVDAALAVIDMAGTEHRGARNAAAQRLAEITADNRHPLAFRRSLVTRLRASIEAGDWQHARQLVAQTNTTGFRSSRDPHSSTVSLCTAVTAAVLNDQDAKDAALQTFHHSPVASERILGRAITTLSDRTLEQVERLRELDVVRSEIRNSIIDGIAPTDISNLAWAMSHTLVALLAVGRRREAERDAATLRRISTLARNSEISVLCTAFTMLVADTNGVSASKFLRRKSYGGFATYLSSLLPKTEVRLTPRQRSCLTLVDRGLTRNEIAAAIGITPGTVGNHLDKAYKKLGLSRIPALTKARQLGLIYAPEVVLEINS